MKLDTFTPRFPIQLRRPGASMLTWHTFRAGADGCVSIEATPLGVVIELEQRTLLLTDQGYGFKEAATWQKNESESRSSGTSPRMDSVHPSEAQVSSSTTAGPDSGGGPSGSAKHGRKAHRRR